MHKPSAMKNLALVTVTFAFAAFAGLSPAQNTERGSTPPGISQDGSSPSDGAIKGGSIQPGESSGMPSPLPPSAEERARRCYELSGTLREQCLKDADAATGGATRAPGSLPRPDPSVRDPRTAPPPQNPR